MSDWGGSRVLKALRVGVDVLPGYAALTDLPGRHSCNRTRARSTVVVKRQRNPTFPNGHVAIMCL